MKAFIILIFVAGAAFVGWKFKEQWDRAHEEANVPAKPGTTTTATTTVLPGMAPSLEATLEASKKRGADGLRDFLTRYGKTIQDPRLGSIELDYVVLLGGQNLTEARRIFARVKQRTPASSPNYSRIKQLANTYD